MAQIAFLPPKDMPALTLLCGVNPKTTVHIFYSWAILMLQATMLARNAK
jgi:hypothetical protein